MSKISVLGPFRRRRHDHGRCISTAVATADALCERRNIRLTELRRRVLELVWSRHEPVGAYEILDQLRHERRRAAPPTVYRALDFLCSNGLVHRIESLNAYVGCGAPGHPHTGQFLICRQCGAAAELEDPAIAKALNRSAARLGFRVDRQTVELEGFCYGCRPRSG